MMIKTELHEIQRNILVALLINKSCHFSKLNSDKLPTDQFSFHIRELIKGNLITKLDDGSYQLTTEGKEFANRFDTDSKHVERQPKSGVVLLVTEGSKILVHQRLKHPYYGFHGFISGKIRFGESVAETAKRELAEESGLTGKVQLIGIEHKTDCDEAGTVLEDKFFYIFQVSETRGKLQEQFDQGKNIWVERDRVLKLPDLFNDIEQMLGLLDKKDISFFENRFKVSGF